MLRDKRSLFVSGSLVVHLSIFFALQAAALRPEKPKLKNVELAILKPPPPVEAPPPEPETKKVLDLTKKVEVVKQPKNEKPPEAPPPAAEPPPPPVFGLSLSSTSDNPNGFNVRVGNTTMTEPGVKMDPKDVKPLTGDGATGKGPVSLTQVSKKPEKIGDCPPFDPAELYPKEAREKEIEGNVRLEVTIAEDGHVSDVKVTKGIGHGLDEIAMNTVRKHCHFQPAQVGNEKVATKIQYTFVFVLPD